MTMSPTKFHELLSDAMATEPPPGDVDGDIRLGQRRLRISRVRRAAAGAVVGVAAVCLATTLRTVPAEVGPDGSDRWDDASMLQACRDGSHPPRAGEVMFGKPGESAAPPVVKASSRTDFAIILALESADGRHWAECTINLKSPSFGSNMDVYRNGSTARLPLTSAPGCPPTDRGFESCRQFFVSVVDRRPTVVAAMQVTTADGVTTTVPSRDTYLVFAYRGDLLADGAMKTQGLSQYFFPIRRVTFLNATGEPIAASVTTRRQGAPRLDEWHGVSGLPGLAAYPALRNQLSIY